MVMTAATGRSSWLRVVDVMTREPLTVTVTETIGEADDLNPDVGEDIVVSGEGKTGATLFEGCDRAIQPLGSGEDFHVPFLLLGVEHLADGDGVDLFCLDVHGC